MRIGVIVPAFNVSAFLAQTLQSVLDQTVANWSLIVIDDGSTDDTAQVVLGYSDPRVHLIRQDNAGVSAARNRGLEAFLCRSRPPDAFMFLDGDDRLSPHAFAQLADTLESCPWAAAACGRYARLAMDGTIHRAASPQAGCVLERLLTRNLFANGGQLLIRREAVEAAGRWRVDLSYGEDWDYWTRVALLGEFVAVRHPEPLLFVRERAGSAYLSGATDPAAYRPAMDAIYANPAIVDRLGAARLAVLWGKAEAETAWSVGRELIRHGRRRDGQHWLGRSIWRAFSLRRLGLIAISWRQSGSFRPYRTID